MATLKETGYFLLLRALKFLLKNKRLERLYRKLHFDTAAPNEFLASNNCPETFFVSAADQSIGRSVFLNQAPFDFGKMLDAVKLLPRLHRRTVLIDIGANIGTICIPAVKRGIFESAIAIEPGPINHALLDANVAVNGLRHKIQTHNIALGGKNGEKLAFELSEDNFGDHRVRTASGDGLLNEGGRHAVTVISETFDSIVTELDPSTAMIWIDVQGYEGYVLAGATKALSKRIPLCIEFWPYGLDRSGCYSLLKTALIDGGYKSFHILGKPGAHQLTHEALDSLYTALMADDALSDEDLLIV